MEISIKEACHENWANMSPHQQGAFCNKCVKTVIDFTEKSLEDIKSFFAGRAQENICGRFEDKQLSALSFDAFFEQFRTFEFTKRFALILFFTFGFYLFGASKALAQSDSLVKRDTALIKSEAAIHVNPDKLTNVPFPSFDERPIITMGMVSAIQSVQSFDWSKVAVTSTILFTEPVKKAGIRPAPLKRKPVDRRSD